jgi:hypothetical protein
MPPLLVGFGFRTVPNGAVFEAILPTPKEQRAR